MAMHDDGHPWFEVKFVAQQNFWEVKLLGPGGREVVKKGQHPSLAAAMDTINWIKQAAGAPVEMEGSPSALMVEESPPVEEPAPA